MTSDLAPADQGAGEGHLVGVLDVAADRHAEGKARDAQRPVLEQASEIESGGFAFDAGVGRDDHLVDALEPLQQLGEGELLRADAALGRERAKEQW